MSDKDDPKHPYGSETFLVHGIPHDEHWEYSHHIIPPITASTAFRLDSTARGAEGFEKFASAQVNTPDAKPIYIYDRLAEPTVALLEHNFRQLEQGPSATAFASGMAAISGTFLAICSAGTHVVAHKTLYGCTYSLLSTWLPRFGVDVTFVDFTVPGEVEAAVRPQTRALYFETPVNPTLDVIDIARYHRMAASTNQSRAQEERLYVVVDNTFATPFCQRPRALGADVVVHSLTKNVMGFGTDMGGMVVGPEPLHSSLRLARKDFGGVVAPRAAWNILVYGLSSLAVRMERQNRTASQVAMFLENHPGVRRVAYPGLKSHRQHDLARRQMVDFKERFAPGLMVYFELAGSGARLVEKARAFMDYLARESYVLTLAVSLGQTKTLIEAPALMTHCVYGEEAERAGMNPGGIRLSMGLEEAEDIIRDLESAFRHIEE